MERIRQKLNQKLTNYIVKFKDDLKEKIGEENPELIKFLYEYQRFVVSKEDLQKRKRVKNSVSLFERCRARRANGEQCTRRKKGHHDLCGTHIKGTPHGMVEISNNETHLKKVETWTQDIKGIIYYIDADNNVYNPVDIFENKINPKVIAKWGKNEDDKYFII